MARKIKHDATAFFNRFNGERHAAIDELRRAARTAGDFSSPEFNKLYADEGEWLKANGIRYCPSARSWVFVDAASAARAEQAAALADTDGYA